MKARVLVIGSGGREHALVWHLKEHAHSVECSPGSDAISELCPTWHFSDFEDLYLQVKEKNFDQIIVGPEQYLADGIVDFLESRGSQVFGPRKIPAQLESSKAFAKDFCIRHQIPTAAYAKATSKEEVSSALEKFLPPFVVKASGLAAGKGVWIGESKTEAYEFALNYLKTHDSVVIEEFIEGRELSCFYLIDGNQYAFLGAARDHKRLLDKDQGPNTGGMGAFSPPDFWTSELGTQIEENFLLRSLKGLQADSLKYRGFLFLGLMLDRRNRLHLLEYNCRLGDPETQCILPRMRNSISDMIASLSSDTAMSVDYLYPYCINVVSASLNYPTAAANAVPLPELKEVPKDLLCFHAGTKKINEGYQGVGGRLFSLVSRGESLESCRESIYSWLNQKKLNSKLHYRKDIGLRGE